MKNTQSLKLNRDFRRLYSRGKSCVGAYVVLYAQKNRLGESRLGLTVSKSTGKAVKRNRLKRLMREGYRLIESKLEPGYDFILVARTRAIGKTQAQIQTDIERSMNNLGILKAGNDKN